MIDMWRSKLVLLLSNVMKWTYGLCDHVVTGLNNNKQIDDIKTGWSLQPFWETVLWKGALFTCFESRLTTSTQNKQDHYHVWEVWAWFCLPSQNRKWAGVYVSQFYGWQWTSESVVLFGSHDGQLWVLELSAPFLFKGFVCFITLGERESAHML